MDKNIITIFLYQSILIIVMISFHITVSFSKDSVLFDDLFSTNGTLTKYIQNSLRNFEKLLIFKYPKIVHTIA